MAGHRKQHGRPPRHQVRSERMQLRLASAATAEEQLAAAYDWFRVSARHIKDAGERGHRLRTVTQVLVREAQAIDGMAQ
jgi:hypothetical protein